MRVRVRESMEDIGEDKQKAASDSANIDLMTRDNSPLLPSAVFQREACDRHSATMFSLKQADASFR